MLYSAFRVWVVLAPQTNELVQMMRPENRPITSQVVEVVHDDSNKQIDNLRGIKMAFLIDTWHQGSTEE